ncbi:MAG: DUF2304 domain-containing protein [Candidatus Falkowbacteria bacterium]
MFQQVFALLIIVFFLTRIIKQKQKNQITRNESIFWITFWLLAATAVIFLKTIDKVVAALGFSVSGINFLLYVAVMLLFYFVFKMRLKIVKMEKDITNITREVALKK